VSKRRLLFVAVILLLVLPTGAFAAVDGTPEFSFGGFLTAILMGLVTFFTPCVLPLIPAYISYMTGLSLGQLKGEELDALPPEEKKKRKRANLRKMFFNALFFFLGILVVYILLGAVFGLIGVNMAPGSPFRRIFFMVLGHIVVLFGLHMTGFVNIPVLNYIGGGGSFKGKSGTLVGSFLMGLTFAFAFSACTSGFLGGIIGMALQANVWGAVILLAAFGIGIGIPFILTALAIDAALNFFEKVKKHMKVVEIIGGLLLVALGVLMILDKIQVVLSFG